MINLFELVEEINKKFLERYYEISEGIEKNRTIWKGFILFTNNFWSRKVKSDWIFKNF